MPSAFQRRPRTLPSASNAPNHVSSSSDDVSVGGSQRSVPTSTSSPSPSSSSSPSSSFPASSHTSLRPPTHPTLRPSPFPQQQPLPLFSLGLHAINDILTGLGLPSGSLSLFLPMQDGQVGQGGGGGGGSEGDREQRRRNEEAGSAYADLTLRYAAAQGIAAGHNVLVVAEQAEEWMRGLMGWTGAESQTTSDRSKVLQETPSTASTSGSHGQANGGGEEEEEEDEEGSNASSSSSSSSKDTKLKVAFRYEKLKRLDERESRALGIGAPDTGNPVDSVPYVHPFDLSMKMPASVLREARTEGRLVISSLRDVGQEENTYEVAWSAIKRQIDSWKASEQEKRKQWSSTPQGPGNSPPPPSPTPIRIVLPFLGSPAWTVLPGQSHAVESYRLLLRLKKLLRSSSWISPSQQRKTESGSLLASPSSHQPADVEIPMVLLCSPSVLLLSPSSDQAAAVAPRLASLADSALAFSSFSADPRLRSIFQPAPSSSSSTSSSTPKASIFTGSLQILKTPSIGSLVPSSIRASQLRGLSSSSADGSSGGSGGENSLGFKVRRKGVKIEVLGRDLVADWGGGGGGGGDEDEAGKRKEKVQSRPSSSLPKGSSGERQTSTISSAPSTMKTKGDQPSVSISALPTPPPLPQHHTPSGHPSASSSTTNRTITSSSSSPQQQGATPLKGLAALRARGLQAASASSSASSPVTQPSPQTQTQIQTQKRTEKNPSILINKNNDDDDNDDNFPPDDDDDDEEEEEEEKEKEEEEEDRPILADQVGRIELVSCGENPSSSSSFHNHDHHNHDHHNHDHHNHDHNQDRNDQATQEQILDRRRRELALAARQDW